MIMSGNQKQNVFRHDSSTRLNYNHITASAKMHGNTNRMYDHDVHNITLNACTHNTYTGHRTRPQFWQVRMLKKLVSTEGTDTRMETAEENSSVFSLIQMRWLPSAGACRQ